MKVLLVLLLMQPSSMPISQLPTKIWWQWCCCHFGSMSMLMTMMLLPPRHKDNGTVST